MSSVVVKASGLVKSFNGMRALDGMDLEVPQGSLYALVGANGAGKTTFFSIVGGFLRPTGGSVEVLGHTAPEGGALRGRLGMLPQDAAFLAGVPVLEQLVFCARLQGFDASGAHAAALQALDSVGLADVAQRNPRALSHGMLKRVALCQAFLGNPEIVFLDEPTAGLDPETARRVRALVREWGGKRTVVISSHNLAELQDLCTHVAILHRGRILSAGSMEDIAFAGCHYRCAFDGAVDEPMLLALRSLAEVASADVVAGELQIRTAAGVARNDAAAAILRCLLALGRPPRKFVEGVSLEHRFLEAIGGQSDGLGGS